MKTACTNCGAYEEIEEEMISEFGNFGFDCAECGTENDTTDNKLEE